MTYVFAAGAGERKTITMPDQSVVHLNAGSRITYDEAYNEDGRELTLEGEAFFEVTEDPQKPFKVLHGGLTTEVLGTSFNIHAYSAAADMKVTVATGRVRVSGAANATLAAGQSLTYVKSSATANVTKPSHVEQSYSWKDGVLAFDSERLGDIAHTLERWYNVTVHLEGEGAANCRFTGAFERLPLEKVLSLLSKNGNFSYRINGRDVYITGVPCP
ncbi:DUF4974 domain-containing protein [Chitinophaga horti]|uniref:DUF4974 domain-containing protein n=1 Tax=Chitinophaga horti TaxID=2920382 RepID=A0ABY6J8R5_9BACT|nr:FecR domain-containing protein [Chitinophaga horti]UYQ95875.1 DUF4974 domain-containing protein [Chitinophaga horti]